MNKYKSGAELKDMAKGKLERNYGVALSTCLTVHLISYLITYALSYYVPGNGLAGYLIYTIAFCLVEALLGCFQTGLALFFLNMACGQPYKIENIFYGMQNAPKASFLISLAYAVLSLLTTLPYQIFARLMMATDNDSYLIWMLVTAGIGLIIYVPLSLALSQSYYLLLDFPDYTGLDALRASCKIMKGHKGRLFLLQLSFLPLQILCIFTCMIGFLWLNPYMNMTYTLFFLDVMNPQKTEI